MFWWRQFRWVLLANAVLFLAGGWAGAMVRGDASDWAILGAGIAMATLTLVNWSQERG